jgi:hypothetical protein
MPTKGQILWVFHAALPASLSTAISTSTLSGPSGYNVLGEFGE